jgi:hypothetical protein
MESYRIELFALFLTQALTRFKQVYQKEFAPYPLIHGRAYDKPVEYGHQTLSLHYMNMTIRQRGLTWSEGYMQTKATTHSFRGGTIHGANSLLVNLPALDGRGIRGG